MLSEEVVRQVIPSMHRIGQSHYKMLREWRLSLRNFEHLPESLPLKALEKVVNQSRHLRSYVL